MIEIDELLKLVNEGVQVRLFDEIEAIKILEIMNEANELMYSSGCKIFSSFPLPHSFFFTYSSSAFPFSFGILEICC
jgi:hypothetical protein